jgi:hypothetical protein
VTRGQQTLEEQRGLPAGWWAALQTELDASPYFTVVARSADGTAYRLVPTASDESP